MNYIRNREELRKVEFPKKLENVVDCDGRGYFHCWLNNEKDIIALVETEDGTMREIPARNIQFVKYFSDTDSAKILKKLEKYD